MSKDPFESEERWLNKDEFSVRREIKPTRPSEKAKRGRNPMPKFLPEVFQDAHPWALQWGGKEVEEGRFYAHAEFNKSAQTRAEYAGLRLAETANMEGVRIRATVAVTRYPERNLLERVTYKFEAVLQDGRNYRVEALGEVTATQSLSQEQRTAIVEGRPLVSSPGPNDVLEYKHGNKVVRIDPKRIVTISSGDVFAALQRRLGGLIMGLERKFKEKNTPRRKETEKAEKKAIVDADKESKARTAAPPIEEQDLTVNKGKDDRGTARGRPAATERATAKTPIVTTTTAKQRVQDRLNSIPRKTPTADETRVLESALSKGRTQVASAGDNQVKVTIKKAAKAAGRFAVGDGKASGLYGITQGLLSEVGVDLPVLDPVELVKGHITKKVSAGVDRGIKWIATNYPPVELFLLAEARARELYLDAKEQIAENGRVWEALIKGGTRYGARTWQIARDRVLNLLDKFDNYEVKINERNSRLAAEINELDTIENQIDTYVSALHNIAQELEDKVELACIMPGGYYFGLQLFGWSQFVTAQANRVSSLSSAISSRGFDYREAIDQGLKIKKEMDDVADKWMDLITAAEIAEGI